MVQENIISVRDGKRRSSLTHVKPEFVNLFFKRNYKNLDECLSKTFHPHDEERWGAGVEYHFQEI